MRYVLGCDPGKTGAIVGVGRARLVILRTPHGKALKGRGEDIMFDAMWNEFDKLFLHSMVHRPEHVFIERVQSFGKEGGPSSFKFGYSAGFMRGIVTAARIPKSMVEPQKWKAYAHIPLGSEKPVSIARACELFPHDVEELMPKRLHWTQEEAVGVADAALIGHYGLSQLPPDRNEFDI